MAGLVAAARLRELGCAVTVREKGTRIGGSMLLSSGVIWRHRDWEEFRGECPAGDERLQRLIWERLDEAIEWLESRGAPVDWDETGNPRTVGKRFEPHGLAAALAGEVELGSDGCADQPAILCTGGFAASPELVTRYVAPAAPLRLRANPWSQGDGLGAALARGAALTPGMDEFYGRNMPDASWDETEFVLACAAVRALRTGLRRGRDRVLLARRGLLVGDERRPGNCAPPRRQGVLPRRRRGAGAACSRSHGGATGGRCTGGVAGGARRSAVRSARRARSLPSAWPRRSPTRSVGSASTSGRVSWGRTVTPLDGLWAAGVDAGGVSTGGYASGLAQALVLGLAAAEDAAR